MTSKRKSSFGENSQTRLQGRFKAPEGNRTEEHPKFTWYSFENLDKKSREAGMNYLRKSALKIKHKILSASIMDNVTDELIEKVIIDPNFKGGNDEN